MLGHLAALNIVSTIVVVIIMVTIYSVFKCVRALWIQSIKEKHTFEYNLVITEVWGSC